MGNFDGHRKQCIADAKWCAELVRNRLSKMDPDELKKFNCGVPVVPLCYEKQKEIEDECKRKFGNTEVGGWCFSQQLALKTLTGCPVTRGGRGRGAGKRAAKVSKDSTVGWLGLVGFVLALGVGALVAYFALCGGGGKKDGKTAKGGASKASKSKGGGKSRIGSRKSAISKRSAGKGGSQRSKLSQASKGKGKSKSRLSSQKK